jgi:hypothetical protein
VDHAARGSLLDTCRNRSRRHLLWRQDPPAAAASLGSWFASAVAVGRCRSPVVFGEMGHTDHTVPARLVFMPAFDSKQQARVLSRLVRSFAQPTFLDSLVNAATPEDAAAIVRTALASDAD